MKRLLIMFMLTLALTINGQPLSVEVDVYRLSRPVVELQQQDQEPTEAPSSRRTVLFWTGIGSAIGCFGGGVAGDGDNSRSGNCMLWGGIGAALGAIIGKVVAADEENSRSSGIP